MAVRVEQTPVPVSPLDDVLRRVNGIRIAHGADPVYELHGVLHYGVGNVPAAVPNTSTYALTNATLPYIVEVAEWGPLEATTRDKALLAGVNTAAGQVTNRAVADALGLPAVEPLTALAG